MRESPRQRRLTSEESQALRAHSRAIRARARELVAKCDALRAKSAEQLRRHSMQSDAVFELRARLYELVSDYSAALSRLNIGPDRAVALVDDLVGDSIRLLPPETRRELRDDVNWWTIESYRAA